MNSHKGAATPAAPTRPHVDLHKPTPRTWAEPANYPTLRQHAAQAALYAGVLGFHAPHHTWTGLSDGRATTLLNDGTRLIYEPTNQSHGSLTAYTPCPGGQHHAAHVGDPLQLLLFQADTATCHTHTRQPGD